MSRCSPALAALFLLAATHGAPAQWSPRPTGTREWFRGLAVVSREVAWASGTAGTFARTEDGGGTWRSARVPGAEGLDFRDVHAVDGRAASLLASGPGELSRIYRTADAGATWSLAYTNPDPAGFLDAIAFWDTDRGLALGDPVGGRFVVLATADGGQTWSRAGPEGMPPALAGEGAFAASGTCLVVRGRSVAWFGTGGGATSRVFRSTDAGRTWTAHPTPIRAGVPTAGVFSIAFRDGGHGLAVGGDYKRPDDPAGVVALTVDGGRTWTAPAGAPPSGYRSAVAHVPGPGSTRFVAVGPAGSDISGDDGKSWRRLGAAGFHAVGFVGPPAVGWAAGDDGTVAAWAFDEHR